MDEIHINRNMNPELNDYAYCYFCKVLINMEIN